MSEAAHFEVYRDKGGGWRWRKQAANGKNTGSSGESYASRQGAIDGADAMRKPGERIYVLDHEGHAFEVEPLPEG